MKTILELYRNIVDQFKKVSIPDPEIDAAILFHFILGLTRSDLVIKSHELVRDRDAKHLYKLVERRLNRVPIAYIIGEQDFYGRSFVVNPSVLIPRPETELLVEKALALGKELIDSRSSLTIMDLGTGSGIIAITLAKELRLAKVYALDRSFSALQTAKINAVKHEVLEQVEFVASDWFSAFVPNRHFDIIISNPPYVAESIKEDLQAELNFEPVGALFSGVDGTIALKNIIRAAGLFLAPGGMLLTEIGYDQKEFVFDYINNLGFFADVAVYDDYAGLPRFLQARLKDN